MTQNIDTVSRKTKKPKYSFRSNENEYSLCDLNERKDGDFDFRFRLQTNLFIGISRSFFCKSQTEGL